MRRLPAPEALRWEHKGLLVERSYHRVWDIVPPILSITSAKADAALPCATVGDRASATELVAPHVPGLKGGGSVMRIFTTIFT